jgi:hypothetical protein
MRRRFGDVCEVRSSGIEQRRAKISGAPRSMKMGNIRSPWRYDDASESTMWATRVRCNHRFDYAHASLAKRG